MFSQANKGRTDFSCFVFGMLKFFCLKGHFHDDVILLVLKLLILPGCFSVKLLYNLGLSLV